jgi:hypothetical protein
MFTGEWAYHVSGIASAAMLGVALAGLAAQVLAVRRRRGEQAGREAATDVLSMTRFGTSFLVFLAYFVYGSLLERFNHYLVWPRIPALLMVLAILVEIAYDRRSAASWLACAIAAAGLVAAGAAAICRPALPGGGWLPKALVIAATIIYAHGGIAQIRRIRATRRTGALSKSMLQLYLIKDIPLVALAVAMGLSAGWPVMLLSGTGIVLQAATLWHFGWVRRVAAPGARALPSAGASPRAQKL